MIDWVSGFIQFKHTAISNGFYIEVDKDGVPLKTTAKFSQCEGSYSDTLIFKSNTVDGDSEGLCSELYFSFNPSKFLQGHNVFGSDDLLTLVYDSLNKLFSFIEIYPTEIELLLIKNGMYRITRVDINYPFLLPSNKDVSSFLRAAEFSAKTRSGRPSMKRGTLYFGKNSRRWTIKMYNKAQEILAKGHQLPEQLKNKHLLEEWIQPILRVELTLRTKELMVHNISHANELTKSILKSLFNEYIKRVDMNKQIRLSDDILNTLPSRLKSTYTLWSNGDDVTDGHLIKRATFYRHRKELLEYGIDITFPMRDNTAKSYTNVIPLMRVLEAKPVQVPSWAYEHNLIHCR